MQYTLKDYDDGYINFVITADADMRQKIWEWCAKQGPLNAIAGNPDNDPQVVSFEKDSLTHRSFVETFTGSPPTSTASSRTLKG